MTQKPTITQTLRNWIQAWLVGVALLILVAIDAAKDLMSRITDRRAK